MCDYENPVVKYLMKRIKKDFISLKDHLIELNLVNGLSEKHQILKIQLENISKFMDELRIKREFNE